MIKKDAYLSKGPIKFCCTKKVVKPTKQTGFGEAPLDFGRRN